MIQLSGLSIFLHRKPKIFEFLTIFTFDDVIVLMMSYKSGNYDILFLFFFLYQSKKISIQNVKNSSHKTICNGGTTNVVPGRIRESDFNGSHVFIMVGIEAK